MKSSYPHVLVVSNNCFSKIDSNGRTVSNFFKGWPKEALAQFYIQEKFPDFSICNNYFCVTDRNAVKAIFCKTKGQRVTVAKENYCFVKKSKSNFKTFFKKNALSMIIRNLVWNIGAWKNDEYKHWLDSFCPDLILFQVGDSAFLYKIVMSIANSRHIPVVVYNSEAYYFKDKYDYFISKGISHLIYPLFIHQLRVGFRLLQRMVVYNIYSCKELKERYDLEFNTPSMVLYTSTDVFPENDVANNTTIKVSYLGNLGVGRHEPLIDIANALQEISCNIKLNVFGKTPNAKVKEKLVNNRGICYNGIVSYENAIQIMKESDILVHVENFSNFYREDLKYAFSTKIADSLAIGKCFLLYAPKEFACSKYVFDNKVGYLVSDQCLLYPTLKMLIASSEKRMKYTESALKIVKKNHNSEKNAKTIYNIIKSVVAGN